MSFICQKCGQSISLVPLSGSKTPPAPSPSCPRCRAPQVESESDQRRTRTSTPGSVSDQETVLREGAQPKPDPPPRTQLGDFRLLREVGRGGMGVVYEAEQLSLKRRVALKVLAPGLALDAPTVARFQREAETAASLQHPGIVPIHAVGEQEGTHFYAMGFIEGMTLSQLLADRPLSPQEAARIAAETLEILQHAHDRGLIHRDIKPSNIMIDREGNVRITDFGLARPEAGSTLTATGQVLGTPVYMSPEQAEPDGDPVDRRCDLYSLGATLYEMLSGNPPFRGDDARWILRQVVTDVPKPPSRFMPGVPRDLDTIVGKAMEKKREHRYSSAAEMAEDLQRFLRGEPILARRAAAATRLARWLVRRRVAFSLAASLLVAAVLGALLLLKEDEPRGSNGTYSGPVAPDVETLLRQGRDALRQGQYDQALALFERVLEAEPENREALVGRAEAMIGKGETDEALGALDSLLAMEHPPPRAFQLRARVRMEARQWREALPDLMEAARLDPDNPELLEARAGVYEQLHDYERQLEDLNHASRLREKRAKVLFEEANALVQHREWEKALSPLEESIREYEQLQVFPPVQVQLRVRIHLVRHDYEAALQNCETALQQKPDEPIWQLYRGRALEGLNRLTDAIDVYLSAVARFPERLDLEAALGEALWRAGRLAAASEHFGERLKQALQDRARLEDRAEPQRYEELLWSCVRCRFYLGQWAEARKELEQLLEAVAEPSPELFYWIARVAERESDWERVAVWSTRALEGGTMSSDMEVPLLLMRARARRNLRRDSEAEADLDLALSRGAEELNPLPLVARGVFRRDRMELGKSLADLDEALRIDPQLALARVHRAFTLILLRRFAEAVEEGRAARVPKGDPVTNLLALQGEWFAMLLAGQAAGAQSLLNEMQQFAQKVVESQPERTYALSNEFLRFNEQLTNMVQELGLEAMEALGLGRGSQAGRAPANERQVEKLISELSSSSPPVRQAARKALLQLGPSALASLESAREKTSGSVRDQLESVLSELRSAFTGRVRSALEVSLNTQLSMGKYMAGVDSIVSTLDRALRSFSSAEPALFLEALSRIAAGPGERPLVRQLAFLILVDRRPRLPREWSQSEDPLLRLLCARQRGSLEEPQLQESILQALGSSSEPIQLNAVVAASTLKMKEALPLLRGLLEEGEEPIRSLVCYAVFLLDPPRDREDFSRRLHAQGDLQVLLANLPAAIRLDDPEADPVLLDLLQDERAAARLKVMELVVATPAASISGGGFELLQEDLFRPAPIRRLEERLDEPEGARLYETVGSILQEEGTYSQVLGSLMALWLRGRPSPVAEGLRRCLKVSTEQARAQALRALAGYYDLQQMATSVKQVRFDSIDDPESRLAIAAALQDTSPGLRYFAAEICGDTSIREAIPGLRALLSDSTGDIAHTAAWALAQMGDGSGREALFRSLRKDHVRYRKAAAEALLLIPDPANREPLLQALQDEQWTIRADALKALAPLKDPTLLRHVLPHVLSDVVTLSREACFAAAALAGDQPGDLPPGALEELPPERRVEVVDKMIELALRLAEHWDPESREAPRDPCSILRVACAVSVEPAQRARGYGELGRLLLSQDRGQEAEELFQAGLQEAPEPAAFAVLVAGVYAGAGKSEQALDWLEAAKQKGYRKWKRLRRQAEFRALWKDPRFWKLTQGD